MKTPSLFAAAAVLALSAPALAQSGAADAGTANPHAAHGTMAASGSAKAGSSETTRVTMKDAQGKDVGEVMLEQTPSGILMRGNLTGLPPGTHAIHVHEVGKCEAPFTSAGAHFNPTKRDHGLMNKKGYHAGDLPNIVVGADGKAQFEAVSADLTLGKKGKGSVMYKDGSTVVVHAKADDHQTGPAGNAGDRIACGVIEQGP